MTIRIEAKGESLARLVREESGENVFLCYQCKKCTSGCPVSHLMDITPNQVLRSLQFGKGEEVLGSRTVWLCASCETCTTRCPVGIDVARVMNTLKIISQREGIKPQEPAGPIFTEASLRSIKELGRMYEVGVMAEMNLRLRQPFAHAGLGWEMFRRGKLPILPERGGFPRDLQGLKPRVPPSPKGVAYYPGCSLHGTAREYDVSTRSVAKKLGLELEEIEGWVCCGASAAHWSSHELAASLPLKNLALVEKKGYKSVTAPCAMCFYQLKRGAHDVAQNPALKEKVAREMSYRYEGGVDVQNAIDTFLYQVGLPQIARQVSRPLSGLKVACYYGCLLTRPPEVTGAEDPEYPRSMDRLMRAIGAQPLDWSSKTDCCGAALAMTQHEAAFGLMARILENARQVGAEALVVACPMCHANLDARQDEVARHSGLDFRLPVFYFTQLMALALGLEEKDIGLGKLLVDPKPLLRGKGLAS